MQPFFIADGVSPDGVFKADRLSFADDFITVDPLGKGDLFAFLNRGDPVLLKNRVYLVDSSFIVFK